MEYTVLAIAALAVSALAAHMARLERGKLLLGIAAAAAGQLIFDNIMAYLGLWHFAPQFMLGIFVPIIPIENLAFGISLFVLAVASYERLRPSWAR